MSEDTSAPSGWPESAAAWIADMGEEGDYGRTCVLDRPMLERINRRRFTTALDVGCGEGRFCRMLQAAGISTVGIDPTKELLRQARRRDPKGDYRIGRAEALEFPDRSFDLVVSYLNLIDIGEVDRAIAEMAQVLQPGGTLLIANLTSFATAVPAGGWQPDAGKELRQRQKIYRRPPPLVDENGMMRYRASKLDCEGCLLKPRCCPNAPARKILRPIHEVSMPNELSPFVPK
jgi:SAM-dependent methyltransferase